MDISDYPNPPLGTGDGLAAARLRVLETGANLKRLSKSKGDAVPASDAFEDTFQDIYGHPSGRREDRPAFQTQIGGNHYKDLAIQPTEYIHRNKLGWCEGNAVKYITRHGLKGGETDIRKAIQYLELLCDLEYPEKPQEESSVNQRERFISP